MICAIVLAAGRSRRMGLQKLLLPIGGRPMIAQVVDELLRSPVDMIFVVTGADTEPIAQELAGRQLTTVVNPDHEGEMLSSVRCGLRALPTECSAVLVVLGDQPALDAALIGEMTRAFDRAGGGIVAPVHAGRRGHPLLFSVTYRGEVLDGFDATGLRGLLEAHPGDVTELPWPTDSVLRDIDSPADYAREQQQCDTGRGIESKQK